MKFTDKDMDWLAGTLAYAAKREIMPRFRKLDAREIRQKTSATDLVTEADIRAERAIIAALKDRYPACRVLGEEAASQDPALLENWAGEGLAFTIDPVDGTYNFATGVPVFGVMLGVVANGEAVAGVIYDPVGEDWIMAVRGGGARLHHKDGRRERLTVAPPVAVSQMVGVVSWQQMTEPLRSTMAKNHARTLYPITYRCAAQEYRLLACGHSHFGVYYKTMPWDHVPGTLIHAEAGGHVARFDGTPYLPRHIEGGIIAAPDQSSWIELRAALMG